MQHNVLFQEVLDSVDRLSLEEQESLIDILQRRIAEQHHEQIAKDVWKARKEYKQGLCQPASADEIMKEILS